MADQLAQTAAPQNTDLPTADVHYLPNRTLGRAGFVDDDFSQLGRRLAQLDALLCVITDADVDADDDRNSFQRLNNTIQRTVYDLASDLAQEAHELHEKLSYAGADALLRPISGPGGNHG